MKGMILAGGGGTRFGRSGCLKPLLKVNGKYLIEYALGRLAALGVSEIAVVTGPRAEPLRAAVGSAYAGLPVVCVTQPSPVGILDAMCRALPALGGEAAVLQLSDELFVSPDYAAVRGALPAADFLCGYVPGTAQEITENYALFCTEENVLLGCREKPKTAADGRKGTGFCAFGAECLALLPAALAAHPRGDLCDFMNELILRGKKGLAVRVADAEININTPAALAYAQQRFEGLPGDG